MSIISKIANGLRDGFLSAAEIKERDEAKKECELGKIICIAAAVCVATATIFSLLTTTFAALMLRIVLGGGTLVLLHDAYRFFDNLQELADNAIVELGSQLSENALEKQLTKGMMVPILGTWIKASLDKMG